MKITKSQLKQLIKEELESVLSETQGYGRFKDAKEKRTWLAFNRIVFPDPGGASGGRYKPGVTDITRIQGLDQDIQKQSKKGYSSDYRQASQQVHMYVVDPEKADPEVVRLIKNLMKRGKGIEFDGGKYYSPMRFVSYKEGVKGM